MKMGEKEKKPLLPKDKKTLMKLGGIFLLGLLLIFLGGIFGKAPPAEKGGSTQSLAVAAEIDMEEKLENILSQIKGVGRVSVCLNYSSLFYKEYAFNENSTQKTQSENGGERSISTTEKTGSKTYFTAGSQNEPLLIQEFAPQPESALIVAEGAGNATIKEELFLAVQSLLGLPANKISIAEMK